MHLIKLAWRNLGRNRRRTIITAIALAFGTALCIATFGLMDGMSADVVSSLTRYGLGHIQVHHAEYPQRRAMRLMVPEYEGLLEQMQRTPGLNAVSPRAYGFALVSHGRKSAGSELVGVDPAREPHVTELHRAVSQGEYLPVEPTPWPSGRELTADEKALDAKFTAEAEAAVLAELDALDAGEADEADEADQAGEAGATPSRTEPDDSATRALAHTLSPPPERAPAVFVGSGLAHVLGAKVGDTIHASTQTLDGQIEEVFLRVAGIYRTGTAGYDRARMYLHIADLQRFLHLEGVHEIAASVGDPEDAPYIASRLRAGNSIDNAIVRSWDEIRPDILEMTRFHQSAASIMMFIVFAVAVIGVINTMVMAVFERTRELSVLKAIGMSSLRVVGMIVLEALLLVLVASAIGTGGGLLLDWYMVSHGIDLSGSTEGFSIGGVGLEQVLHAKITLKGVLAPAIMLSLTCVLASLYPAIQAARMQPAVGMRET